MVLLRTYFHGCTSPIFPPGNEKIHSRSGSPYDEIWYGVHGCEPKNARKFVI